MPSKPRRRWKNSLALRLTIWYGASFITIASALSLISYMRLSSAVHDNRKIIQAKIDELTRIAPEGGFDGITRSNQTRYPIYSRKAVFVRIVDPQGNTKYETYPDIWKEFSSLSLSQVGIWQYVPSTKDRDILELMTVALPSGDLLQAAKEIQDRREILRRYRETIIAVTSAIIVIGLAGGGWLAFRALQPVRDITDATDSIVATGNINARVPESGRKDELEDLAKLFNQMLARIASLITGMRDALDNVAHDLRTPLTRLRGVAEMALRDDRVAAHERDALISCIEESDRMLALLNTLMDIAEAENGAMRLYPESVNVSTLIQESVDLYEFIAEEKNISIAVDCAADVRLTGDRARMRQVLVNLLDNAIKYTGLMGHIWIKAIRQDAEVSISVRDDGCGFLPEEKSRIWERLHRGDRSRSQPGLGLGLSLVRAIVEAHRGHVDAQATPGQGSVFTVYFPNTSIPI
jgi:signal transduction histidine kinase